MKAELGKAIRTFRVTRGWSQAELAKQAEISVSYLSMLERNKRDPSFSTVKAIADALDVPMTILVFAACDPDEITSINRELAEQMSALLVDIYRASMNEATA